jgi:hypothetical protein
MDFKKPFELTRMAQKKISTTSPLINRIKIANLLIVLFITALTSLLFPLTVAASVLAGGLIGVTNLFSIHRSLKKAFLFGGTGAKSFMILNFLIRFIFVAIILYFLITAPGINYIALFVGLSLNIITIILTTLSTVCIRHIKFANGRRSTIGDERWNIL